MVPFIFALEYPLLLPSKALSAALQRLKNGNFSVLKVQSKVGGRCVLGTGLWAGLGGGPSCSRVWEKEDVDRGLSRNNTLVTLEFRGLRPTMPAAPRNPRKD